MNSLGDRARVYAGVGQESAPSMTFGAEPVTGAYLENPGPSSSYSISKRGTKRLRITDTETQIVGTLVTDGVTPTGPLSLPDGSSSRPSLTFTSDTDTGIYRGGSGTVVLSSNGIPSLSVSNGGSSLGAGQAFYADTHLASSGSAATPSYSFLSDNLMGMYRKAAGQLALTDGTGTIPSLSCSSTGTTVRGTVLADDGSSSAPAFSFSSQPAMGFSRGGSNILNMYSGGTAASLSTTGLDVLTGRHLSVTGDLNSSSLTCNNDLMVGGNGYVVADLKAGAFQAVGDGSLSGPKYYFQNDSKMGMYRAGSGQLALTYGTGATSPALTLSSTGASVSGGVTCTGDVVSTVYNIFAVVGATQAILNSTVTGVAFTSKTSGSNIAFSNPTTNFTIPVAGWYSVNYGISYAVNSTGLRTTWIRINGGTVQLATSNFPPVSGDVTRCSGGFQYQFAASDTLQLTVYQTSGGTLNIAGDAGNLNFISINRLHA